MVSMTLFKVQMEHNFQEKIAFSHFRKNETCEFKGLKVSLEQIIIGMYPILNVHK